jgi:hypothetical protein
MKKVKDKNSARNKDSDHQHKINFVIDELNNRPDALTVICRMLDFEKRYMLPVRIKFPSIEKTLNVDDVLDNWKRDHPEEFKAIKLLWRDSEFSTDRHGNEKECLDEFVIKHIKQSY